MEVTDTDTGLRAHYILVVGAVFTCGSPIWHTLQGRRGASRGLTRLTPRTWFNKACPASVRIPSACSCSQAVTPVILRSVGMHAQDEACGQVSWTVRLPNWDHTSPRRPLAFTGPIPASAASDTSATSVGLTRARSFKFGLGPNCLRRILLTRCSLSSDVDMFKVRNETVAAVPRGNVQSV